MATSLMHEFAIANSIVSTVVQEMESRNLSSLQEVGIRVGALSGVDPEALRFSFEVIIKETPYNSARLVIDNVSVQGKCHACNQEFEVQNFIFVCPHCASEKLEVTHGEELDIAYLTVDEEDGRFV